MFEKIRYYLKSVFSGSAIIPWMMVASLIPMLLTTYLSYRMVEATIHEAVNRALTLVIQKKVELIDNYIQERKLNLVQLSSLPALVEVMNEPSTDGQSSVISLEAMNSLDGYLKYIAPKIGIDNLYLLNATGRVIYTLNPNTALNQQLSQDNKNYLALFRAYDGARILRMPYVFSHYNQNHSADIYLSDIILDQNKMKGILVLELNTNPIERIMERYLGYGKSEKTFLAMMDNNNPVVILRSSSVRSNGPRMETSKVNTLLTNAIKGKMGYVVEENKTNPIVAVYRYVPQLNMGMLSQYNQSEIFEKLSILKGGIFTLVSIGLLIVALIVYIIARSLWEAHRKSDLLLEQMLPKFVVEELKEKKEFIAKNVDNISVIFLDIVNFTAFASSRPPEVVVEVLDELFSIIDNLCDKYQLEKIKTIGDAHMSVAGLIYPQKDHAARAVDMGLEAILAVQHYNLDNHTNFALRVGVDSGMITGGVIGKRKFSYDIWGHVVNRASRMESTGVANTVQITTDTYAALPNKENYVITYREGVQVKGLGEMNTYLIEKRITG